MHIGPLSHRIGNGSPWSAKYDATAALVKAWIAELLLLFIREQEAFQTNVYFLFSKNKIFIDEKKKNTNRRMLLFLMKRSIVWSQREKVSNILLSPKSQPRYGQFSLVEAHTLLVHENHSPPLIQWSPLCIEGWDWFPHRTSHADTGEIPLQCIMEILFFKDYIYMFDSRVYVIIM